MKLATFVTDQEMVVPFLAPVLNIRFNAFLAALAKRMDMKYEDIIDASRDVLERAEIPQK